MNDEKPLPKAEPEKKEEDEEGETKEEDPEAPASLFKTKGEVNMHWFIQYILLKRISN